MGMMAAMGGMPGGQVVPRVPPQPKSKGVYMPPNEHSEKKAVLDVAALGALLGAGAGSLRAPAGRRWQGAGHGAVRGGATGVGAGLGGLGGMALGGLSGLPFGPVGAGVGMGVGGLAGAGAGGYGGYQAGKAMMGPFPGSEEEKAEKKKDKDDGKARPKSEKKGEARLPLLTEVLGRLAAQARRA